MEAEHPEQIGGYDIVGVIGKGAMGTVYKGVERATERVVAIKVLPPEFLEDGEQVERFKREAQAVALLNHPNVVRIVENNQENEQLYFVMEFVPGTSLDTILRQRRLSLPEAIRVTKSVCSGLAAAHKKSIIHRDLSPKNILVSEDLSVVKIADFGISRVEAVSRQQGTLSTTEFSLGSLHYIAPEQARNMVSADHRADIYSLGVMLYEMLTGRVPVGQFNLPSQLNSEVPPELDPIVLRCLEVDPQRRYPTVGRLITEMRQLENQLRLGLVHEVRGFGRQTSKIFLKSSGGRSVRMWLVALGAAGLALTAFLLVRGSEERSVQPPFDPASEAGVIDTAGIGDSTADATQAQAAPEEALEAEEFAPAASQEGGGPGAEDNAAAADRGTQSEPSSPPATDKPASRQPASPAVAKPPTPVAGSGDLEVARKKLEAGLPDEALADVEEFLANYPASSYAPEALLLLGQIHERKNDSAKARATYIELQSRHGGTDAATESMYRRAKLLAAEGERQRVQDSRVLLAEIADEYPQSKWAPVALLDKAAIEVDAKISVRDSDLGAQVPAALVTYRKLVSEHPTHPGTEEALWQLGEMYTELKEFKLAAAAYESLGTRFPKTRHDAWWSAAQTYDRRLDDDDRAIAAYRKIPRTSRRYDDAQRRIAKLSR